MDCALIEEDGIVLLDFKTDTVTENTIGEKVANYSSQIETYAKALSRIYEKPIKSAYLYFFRVKKLIPIL